MIFLNGIISLGADAAIKNNVGKTAVGIAADQWSPNLEARQHYDTITSFLLEKTFFAAKSEGCNEIDSLINSTIRTLQINTFEKLLEKLKIINTSQAIDLNWYLSTIVLDYFYTTDFNDLVKRKIYTQMVIMLIEKGADPNKRLKKWYQSEEQCQLIQAVVQRNHEALFNFLLEKRVDLKIKDVSENTLLHLAAQADVSISIFQKLVELNSEAINRVNLSKQTPLHIAADRGNLAFVKCLLEKNSSISINYPDHDLNTPLHLAAQGRLIGYTCQQEKITQTTYAEIIKLLLQCKADHNLKNKENHTPLEIAKQKGHLFIVEVLENAKNSRTLSSVTSDTSENKSEEPPQKKQKIESSQVTDFFNPSNNSSSGLSNPHSNLNSTETEKFLP